MTENFLKNIQGAAEANEQNTRFKQHH